MTLLLERSFLDLIPKVKAAKAKPRNWDCIKLKGFCTVVETISKVKREPTKWKEIFANHVSDKGLTSKIQ